MEIIIGCIIGTVVSGVLLTWVSQKKTQQEHHTEEVLEQYSKKATTLPLEKKLRNAIYDCEQQLKKCEQKINEACQQQLDLTKDIGKKSHIEVRNKPVFFSYYHPLSQEQYFYYTKDLDQHLPPTVLEKTSHLLQQYQEHLDLLEVQRKIFQQLLDTHQENLNRLSGVSEQKGQLGKINQHQKKLAQLKGTNQLEEQAIYGELVLKEIAEELEFQEECTRQYTALQNAYQQPLEQAINEMYQQKLQQLLIELQSPPL